MLAISNPTRETTGVYLTILGLFRMFISSSAVQLAGFVAGSNISRSQIECPTLFAGFHERSMTGPSQSIVFRRPLKRSAHNYLFPSRAGQTGAAQPCSCGWHTVHGQGERSLLLGLADFLTIRPQHTKNKEIKTTKRNFFIIFHLASAGTEASVF